MLLDAGLRVRGRICPDTCADHAAGACPDSRATAATYGGAEASTEHGAEQAFTHGLIVRLLRLASNGIPGGLFAGILVLLEGVGRLAITRHNRDRRPVRL